MTLDPRDLRGDARERQITFGFYFVAFLLALVQVWLSRHAMNNDGIQYLDNAAMWTRDPAHALNPLWSPLYPWLIAAWFALTRPDPFLQIPLVHVLNFFIFLASLRAFLFFLRAIRNAIAPRQGASLSFLLLAYASFLYCSLDMTNLAYVTPDLLLSCFAFLAAGWLARILSGSAAIWEYAALGAVCGLGYLAKAPFLLLGLLSIGMAAWLARKQRAAWMRSSVACLAFLAVVVPYVWLLSNAQGRVTFGDSGKSNVLWHVNGVPVYNWQGGPPENGRPIHPTRQISSHPAIFEFATPVGGTYPPWYDPIYWTIGGKIAFRPADFARALMRQLQLYGYLLHHRQLALIFALCLLFFLIPEKKRAVGQIWMYWPVLILGFAPFAMYAFVHAEGRYLAPFFVMLWTALFAGLLNGSSTLSDRLSLGIATIAAALMLIEAATVIKPDSAPGPYYEVARSLEGMGLRRGDQVALVSQNIDYYWAYLAGARITMQIEFDAMSCPDCAQGRPEWELARQIALQNGVAFVVSPCIAGVVDQPGWRQLGDTKIYANRLY
jgi:hypothetical protein